MARQLTNLLIRTVYIPERKNMSFEKEPVLLICRNALFLFYPSDADLKRMERADWAEQFSSSDLMAVSSRFTGRTFFRKAMSRKAIAAILLKHTADSLKNACTDSRMVGPYPADCCTLKTAGNALEILDHGHPFFHMEGKESSSLLSALQSAGFTIIKTN